MPCNCNFEGSENDDDSVSSSEEEQQRRSHLDFTYRKGDYAVVSITSHRFLLINEKLETMGLLIDHQHLKCLVWVRWFLYRYVSKWNSIILICWCHCSLTLLLHYTSVEIRTASKHFTLNVPSGEIHTEWFQILSWEKVVWMLSTAFSFDIQWHAVWCKHHRWR